MLWIIAKQLARVMGCPCCGPVWYRKFVVAAYQSRKMTVPPELRAGV